MIDRPWIGAWGLALGLLVGCSDRPVGNDGVGGGSTTSATTGGASSGADGATGGTGAGPGTSTSGVGTSTGSPDDSAGDCPFICEPDLGDQIDCNVVAQDCPAGSKCVWYTPPQGGGRREAARCIEVTGDGAPFDPCTLPTGIGPEITDDCGASSFCLEVYGTADHGFCAPFYDPRTECSEYPGTYPAFENGSDFPAACLHYECQPLLPGSCPAGMSCTFYPAWLYGSMHCWSVPDEVGLPLGAECDFGGCGEGHLCAPAEWLPDCVGERCCAAWCDLDAPACATPGTSCEPFPVWNYHDDPGFESLGTCVLPGAFD